MPATVVSLPPRPAGPLPSALRAADLIPALKAAAMNGHTHLGSPNGGTINGGTTNGRTDQSDSEDEDKSLGFVIPEDRLQGFGVDQKDVGTPDDWVPRHPELVRLTGRHPFNCEPPLQRLRQHGFLTPVSLHYVRNHGPVPRAEWASWSIEVSGLVARPCTLTMADLLALPRRTLPVTMVCAGNRRKEENMVKQTIGFNWGAAGTSTTIWGGVRLSDVLKHVGAQDKREGANYVCFEGDETLPGGGGNKYGTSLKMEVAADPACDVLLAFEQNGRRLEPDHGFPVRTIIPGYIGGRTVKWLRKIEVTREESQNYYHFHDNRVLPSQVDAERANKEGWWFKPDFIINELNVQSAIWSPAHGEVLSIANAPAQYTIGGYAYSGGGRKIIRVEVSLDAGESWELAELAHPEQPTEYGKYWCWALWELQVDVMHLFTTKELMVRAWDSSMNTQPDKITWNVMGMMNNCWYRVRIHPCRTREGGIGLTFEHPTRPGNEKGGWMVKEKEEKDLLAAPAAVPVMKRSASQPRMAPSQASYPLSEVKRHDSEKDAWIVVHSKVYNATKFLDDHPGGAESILINAGTDCTDEFEAIHSAKAKAMLEDYYIGELAVTSTLGERTPEGSLRGGSRFLRAPSLDTLGEEAEPAAPAVQVALNPRERIPFQLIRKDVLSRDVRRFRFALQSPQHVLGLPVGKHMFLSATVDGKFVMRAYTPTSSDDDVGYFDLVIKVYAAGVHPKFPAGGVLSQYLDRLALGDTVDVKGPVGHFVYHGDGAFSVNGKPKHTKRISMLAGGTGITPMFQVLQAILKKADDPTCISLIYCNQTEADILLREDMEALAAANPDRFKIWYTVDRAGPEWKYSTGYINEAMVKEHLFPADPETIACMCGPPGMIKFACIPSLEKAGYDADHYFSF